MSSPNFLKNWLLFNYQKHGWAFLIKEWANSESKISLGESQKIFQLDKQTNSTLVNNRDEELLSLISPIIKQRAARLKIRAWLEKKLIKQKIINDQDLYFNNFENSIDTLELREKEKIYQFNCEELVNIVTNALEHSIDECIIKPELPKNPYNNNKFSEFHLSQIYNFIKKQGKNTIILDLFYESSFDIPYFMANNYQRLTKISCVKFIQELSFNEKMTYFKEMNIDEKSYIVLKYIPQTIRFFQYYENQINELLSDYKFYEDYLNSSFYQSAPWYTILKYKQKINTNYKKLCELYRIYFNGNFIHFPKRNKIRNKIYRKKSRKNRKKMIKRVNPKRKKYNQKVIDDYLNNTFTFSKPLNIDCEKDIFYSLEKAYELFFKSIEKKWWVYSKFYPKIFLRQIDSIRNRVVVNYCKLEKLLPFPLISPKFSDPVIYECMIENILTQEDLKEIQDIYNGSYSESDTDDLESETSENSLLYIDEGLIVTLV